ncbi:MAG: TolC family protein [Clostridium sp.]|nr:TolC family protein [Clostridium sp.]
MRYVSTAISRLRTTGCAVVAALLIAASPTDSAAQTTQTVSLDSCRRMALANNKQLRIRAEQLRGAGYTKKEAFAAYLPSIDFAGGYLYNQKEISIFGSDQLLPVKNFNLQTQQYEFSLVKNPMTGEPVKGPDGQYIPEQIALIPKSAMEYDIHNVFFGAVTLTQPVYMGGKIVAMNKITRFAEEAAGKLRDNEAENVICAVDGAYWQVVSLKAKYRLAISYLALLDSLRDNVSAMLAQGVATRSDLLSVDVKLNAAQVDLVKVENGLTLSRMALAQVCGLPVNTPLQLDDEDNENPAPPAPEPLTYDMDQVYAARPDLQALELSVRVMEQKERVALSSMLPNVALVGSYSFSNPNLFDGFRRRFSGAFSVGAMVTIPIWHWGGNYNKYRAAKTETAAARLQVEDARELIDLQVSQSNYRMQEATKTYQMTQTNMAKADENLRSAQLGYREGVLTADNVMEAQTAWLKASSERIDAMIDLRLCHVYLEKALGRLH